MALACEDNNERGDKIVAQRLERLERKLDTLLALEQISDMHWSRLDAGTPADIDITAARFDQLAVELGRLLDKCRTFNDGRPPSVGAAGDGGRLAAQDDCYDRLLDVAAVLVAMRASSFRQLRIKAMALQELAEESSDDLVHQLAGSVAADLLRIGKRD